MKKLPLTLLFLCIFTVSTFAQTETSFLDVKEYSSMFLNSSGNLAVKYVMASSVAEYKNIANLVDLGTDTIIDDPLEIVLLSYYSQPVQDIRPPEANAILPANNPKLASQKIGAVVFMDMQLARFLNDTQAVTRHEAMLKFITDRNNVTRAEIETFYRNAIRPFIAGIVDEEFGKISFVIQDTPADRTYSAVLTRNSQNGNYTLSYLRPEIRNSGKEFSAPTLDALLAEMRRNTSDFAQPSIDTVRTQAALIPVVVLSKQQLDDIITAITNFYTSPSDKTFALLKEWDTLITEMQLEMSDPIFFVMDISYSNALAELNEKLASKVVKAPPPKTYTYITNDQRQKLRQVSNVRGR